MSDITRADATYSEAIRDAHRYTDWIVSQFRSYLGSSTLEIGIGHGSFIHRLSKGRQYTGLDIDPEAVQRARTAHPEHAFYCADLVAPEFSAVVAARFDSVVCCNVLEHIADDALAVGNLSQVLVPGGHLLLFVPALPALYSDLDRLAGHHRRYTRQALDILIKNARLSTVELRYFNPLGALGWWMNRAARHNSLNDAAVNSQIRAFNRWGVPVSRALDPLFRRILGQSLLCVARRT